MTATLAADAAGQSPSTAAVDVPKGHPQGLYVLFVTEMWERFSYYGMRAIFALFMTKALLFTKSESSTVYGSYTGLVYLTPLLGGYMADRYWGNRRSIITGGILMAAGQFLMFCAGTFYSELTLAKLLMYSGLTLLILGNGFFKPNISTMVGQLYPVGDKRVDSAFTIFYMGINLGAFIAPLTCGYLGDTGQPGDFRWGFLAAGVGMVLSLILFVWLKNEFIVTPQGEQIGVKPNRARDAVTANATASTGIGATAMIWVGVFAALLLFFHFRLEFDLIGSFIYAMGVAAPGYIISDPSLTKIERARIIVIYVVASFVIFFWSAFEQAGASLTYFAEEQTERHIGWQIPPIGLRVMLAMLVAAVGLVMQRVAKFSASSKVRKQLKVVLLTLLSLVVAGFAYAFVFKTSAGYHLNTVPASYFQSINAVAIVLLAPLFVTLWGALGKRNLEPASPYKQALGLMFLALGYVVIAAGVKDLQPGVKVSMGWLLSLYTIHTLGELSLSPIGLSMVNKLAPARFASLLMGVWFMSISAANKFAGDLSALYPEPVVAVSTVEAVEQEKHVALFPPSFDKAGRKIGDTAIIPMEKLQLGNVSDVNVKAEIQKFLESSTVPNAKSFIGFKVETLYDFFKIFVMMAGASSLILFALSSLLLKMMHGVR